MSADRLTQRLALLSAAQCLLFVSAPGKYSPERMVACASAAEAWMKLADRIGGDSLSLEGLDAPVGWT